MTTHKQILEGQWKEGRDFVPDLLRAKGESDRKNYSAKHDILRRLIKESPGEFVIDSEESGIYGITHRPSGFKIHLLKAAAPPELTRAQPEKQDKATVLNRIMKKHSRPGTKDSDKPILVPPKAQGKAYYHGSARADLQDLAAGSYVTPWLEDAMSFGVPWSSRELEEGHRNQPGTDGRPPLKLRFKGEIPSDHPIYIYKILQDAARGAALTNSGAEYDWNSTVTEDTPVELVKTIPSWHKEMLEAARQQEKAAQVVGSSDVDKATVLNRIMKKHSRPGTEKQEDDVYVHSSVPAASLDMVKKHGLLSSQALLTNPEALASFLDSRKGTHLEVDEEGFKKTVEGYLKGNYNSSMRGPSVFFGEPDPDKITDAHHMRRIKSEMLRVNLSKLLRDHPKTRIQGTELHPNDPEDKSDAQWDSRYHDIDLDKVREYVATDPKELWKHYDSPEGTHYASDVPHAQLITPSGGISPEYLEFTDTQEAIFDKLKEHLPEGARHSSGGMPDVRGTSDVDVSLYHSDPAQVFELLPKGTTIRSQREDTGSIEYAVPGYSRDVNVYVTSDPDAAQRSVDHRRTEIALQEQFPELYQSAIALKREGRNTEQAWAETLGVKNYPYAAMRDTKAMLAAAVTLKKQDKDFGKQAAEEQWIGVDLDGTLAKYRGWKGATHIGAPIPSMVSRVKRWLREGKVVKIFTARVAGDDGTARRAIEKWCETHIGKVLPITCVRDKQCVRIWDDRAVGVKSNSGRQVKLEYADKIATVIKLAKARSKSQQRLFGMVHAAQKGEDVGSAKVQEMAKTISKKDVSDFAETKHKGLPNRKLKKKKSKDKEASANVLGNVVAICLVNHSSVS